MSKLTMSIDALATKVDATTGDALSCDATTADVKDNVVNETPAQDEGFNWTRYAIIGGVTVATVAVGVGAYLIFGKAGADAVTEAAGEIVEAAS